MKWFGFFTKTVLIFLLAAACVQSQAIASDAQIVSEEAAIKKAIAITGFDRLEGFPGADKHSAELVMIKGDSTPFVGRLINDREIWKVNLVNVPLKEIRPGGREVETTFEVLIDPAQGKPLKIHSRYVDTTYVPPRAQEPEVGPPLKMPKADGDSATLFLIPTGPDPNEKDPLRDERGFAGLPDAAPRAFLDVMQHSPVNMGRAIWLDAAYVLVKIDGQKKAIPVWKVWLHGHPDVVTESSSNLYVRPSPDPNASTTPAPKNQRTYLQTVLVTADGALAECLSVKVSRWKTLSGDLPPGSRRLYQSFMANGSELSITGEDFSNIYISFTPPGELLVTDPAGRKTGTDAVTGREYNEIPRSAYYDNSIGDPEGLAMMYVMGFEARLPLSGDFKLTVTTRDSGAYGLGMNWYDVSDESSAADFDRISILPGTVHTYTFSFDRLSALRSTVTGGFDGSGGEPSVVDRFLSYVNIADATTKFPSGTDSTSLFIIYDREIITEDFTATLNGEDVSALFTPAEGKYELANIPLQSGENLLVVSSFGFFYDGIERDTDSLIFVVE